MKQDAKIAILFAIFLILSITCVSLLFLFIAPFAPLFTVNNHDDVVHNVRVDVFDKDGKKIAMEEASLAWGEDITHSRSLWQFLPVSREYVFIVKVDGKANEIHSVVINDPHSMLTINVYDSLNETHIEVAQVA
jgi:hypothetical protein